MYYVSFAVVSVASSRLSLATFCICVGELNAYRNTIYSQSEWAREREWFSLVGCGHVHSWGAFCGGNRGWIFAGCQYKASGVSGSRMSRARRSRKRKGWGGGEGERTVIPTHNLECYYQPAHLELVLFSYKLLGNFADKCVEKYFLQIK